jgi:hypothetical protein
VKSFGLPLLLLGGGGYTINNVARCWAYETAVLVDEDADLPNNIPGHEYSGFYEPNHEIHLTPDPDMVNTNTKDYLDKYSKQILQNLAQLKGAPSVEMIELPPEPYLEDATLAGVAIVEK